MVRTLVGASEGVAPLAIALVLACAAATTPVRAQTGATLQPVPLGRAREAPATLLAYAARVAEGAQRLEQAGDTAAAIARYVEVVRSAEDSARRADAAGALPNPYDAIVQGTALLEMGRLYAGRGERQRAADAFASAERALLDAERRAAANRRGPIAVRLLVDARPTIFTALGDVNTYQGKYAIARGYYTEALRLDPRGARARDGLAYADVLDRRRTPAEARSAGTPTPAWLANFLASEQSRAAGKAITSLVAARLFGAYGAVATPLLLYVAEQLTAPRGAAPSRR